MCLLCVRVLMCIRPWWDFVVVIALFDPGFSLGLDASCYCYHKGIPVHVHACVHMYCHVQGIKEIDQACVLHRMSLFILT